MKTKKTNLILSNLKVKKIKLNILKVYIIKIRFRSYFDPLTLNLILFWSLN